jgi:hypothetical protein
VTARAPDDLDIDRLNREGGRSMALLTKQARYSERAAKGLCVRGASHGPAEPGHSVCTGCLVDQRLDRIERNAELPPPMRILTCKICGRERHNSRSCTQARPAGFDPRRVADQRRSDYRRKLHADGLCINGAKHARPESGFRQCAECRARGKAKS